MKIDRPRRLFDTARVGGQWGVFTDQSVAQLFRDHGRDSRWQIMVTFEKGKPDARCRLAGQFNWNAVFRCWEIVAFYRGAHMTTAVRKHSYREKLRKELQPDGHSFPGAHDIALSTGDGFIYTFDQMPGSGGISFGELSSPDSVEKYRGSGDTGAAVSVEPVADDDVDDWLRSRLGR
jgi:hypothetical protein